MSKLKCALLAAASVVVLATPAIAQLHSIKTGYLACRQESALMRAEEIRRSGDDEALKTYLMATLLSTACIWLPVGKSVYYEGSGSIAAVAKVRPQGEITSFFTRIEILD